MSSITMFTQRFLILLSTLLATGAGSASAAVASSITAAAITNADAAAADADADARSNDSDTFLCAFSANRERTNDFEEDINRTTTAPRQWLRQRDDKEREGRISEIIDQQRPIIIR